MQKNKLPKRKRFFLIASAGVFVLALIAFALLEFTTSGSAEFAPMVYADLPGVGGKPAEQIAVDIEGNGARVLTEAGKKGAMCTYIYQPAELSAVQKGLTALKNGQVTEPAKNDASATYRLFYGGKWFIIAADTSDASGKALVDALFGPARASCK